MGMRTDVHRLAGAQDGGTHPVEEDEGADQPATGGGQGAAHLEAADVAGVGDDHQLDRVAGEGVAGLRIVAGEEAHDAPILKCLEFCDLSDGHLA